MGDNYNNNNYGVMPERKEQNQDIFMGYSQSQHPDNVCRDFLRNACNRGVNCRYHHPEDHDQNLSSEASNREMTFCHDFQNRGCKRAGCKFLHCTREEVDEYKRTGMMPRSAQASLQKVPPICMDYKNGNCSRGPRCKYRHMNEVDIQSNYEGLFSNIMMTKKRKYMEDKYYDEDNRGEEMMKSNEFNKLKEENVQLKKRIEDLERQLSVLVASNELLLEQNARYRSCKLITVPPIVAVSQITPNVPTAPTIGASRPHPTLTQQTPHGITTTATLSIGTNQREFVLPPPSQPPPPQVQPSLHSQVASVDQNSMTIAPMALSLTPCTNLSNVALSQQMTMTATPALSLSMPLPSHSAHLQNSNLVSYPLTSNQQSRVK